MTEFTPTDGRAPTAYAYTITRDGDWWMISIPALNGLTQARRVDEAEHMARDYVAVTLDVPYSSVSVVRTERGQWWTEEEADAIATAIVTRSEFDETGRTIFGILTPAVERERRAAKAEALDGVRALHRPDETGDWCDHCWTGPNTHGNGPSAEWPCATIRAVEREVGDG